MIVVYSENTSPRLRYTLKVLFCHVLKTDYQLVSLSQFKKETTNPKLNYSSLHVENCVQITPHHLLFDKKINPQNIEITWNKKIPFFFKTSQKNIQFDVLASSFYMITRYEEYLPTDLDSHQRFKAENTLAFKNNFLQKPVVNLWANYIAEELLKQFPNFSFPKKQFSYISTFDIDIAYAYKGKSTLKQIGGFLKNIVTGTKTDFQNRWNFYINKKKDPFDMYAYIFKMHKKYPSKSIFFFLMGNPSKYDKNLPISSKPFIKLIKKIATKNTVGIHPSYQSNIDRTLVKKEINHLSNIVKKDISKSRQHFLKLEFPKTYENLIKNNIKEDYTMGFASQIGFRAGICTPYPFFNLTTNKTTDLLLFPFQIMDGTLNEYLQLSTKEAIFETQKIIDEIKKVNGLFISLWHNSSLSDQNHWKNWREVFEESLKRSTTKST